MGVPGPQLGHIFLQIHPAYHLAGRAWCCKSWQAKSSCHLARPENSCFTAQWGKCLGLRKTKKTYIRAAYSMPRLWAQYYAKTGSKKWVVKIDVLTGLYIVSWDYNVGSTWLSRNHIDGYHTGWQRVVSVSSDCPRLGPPSYGPTSPMSPHVTGISGLAYLFKELGQILNNQRCCFSHLWACLNKYATLRDLNTFLSAAFLNFRV